MLICQEYKYQDASALGHLCPVARCLTGLCFVKSVTRIRSRSLGYSIGILDASAMHARRAGCRSDHFGLSVLVASGGCRARARVRVGHMNNVLAMCDDHITNHLFSRLLNPFSDYS